MLAAGTFVGLVNTVVVLAIPDTVGFVVEVVMGCATTVAGCAGSHMANLGTGLGLQTLKTHRKRNVYQNHGNILHFKSFLSTSQMYSLP